MLNPEIKAASPSMNVNKSATWSKSVERSKEKSKSKLSTCDLLWLHQLF